MNNVVNDFSKILSSISNKPLYDDIIYNEHYIGVIVDNHKHRYNKMKKIFESVNNEKLHRHYHKLKKNHNKYLDSKDNEMKYEHIITNFEHIDIDKLEEVTNIFEDHDKKNKQNKWKHMITLIGQYFSGKKPLDPVTLQLYKDRVKDNKSVFENDKDQWKQLYEDFENRNTVIEYLKKHYTYVFIGKDKTFAFEHHGNKDLPRKYCKKNIIYNSYNLDEVITTDSDKFITNDNSSLASIFDNEFPTRLNEHLDLLEIEKEDRRRIKSKEIKNELSLHYCKCKTDSNGTKVKGYCKKHHGTTLFNDNTAPKLETFSGTATTALFKEGLKINVLDINTLEDHYNNSINNINNHYENYIKKIDNEQISYNDLNEKYNISKGTKDKLKDTNQLYKQMINDNILISNRNTIIRYLVIIILIFLIILLMKYINII